MSDSMILSYFEIVTDVAMEEIEAMQEELKQGANPRDLKARLAHTVVTQFIGEAEADAAQAHFEQVFTRHEMPEDIEEYKLSVQENIVDVLVNTKLAQSKTEARRLIGEGAIKVDQNPVKDVEAELVGTEEGVVLQRGKRHFIKLVS